MVHVRGKTPARRPLLGLLVLASLLAGMVAFQNTPTMAAPLGTISDDMRFVAASSSTTPTAAPCDAPPWNPTTIYTNGGTIVYDGRIWRARWWTQGETPGSSEVWEDLGPCGTPTPTPTATPTKFPCPTRTPVPLFVDPVSSPTNLLSQQIRVYTTDAQTITVQSEAGLTTYTGPTPWPTAITVDLLADTQHHLTVTAHIRRTVDSNGCVSGGYALQATRDRNGAPLVIVQMTGSPTATPTPICPVPVPIPLSVEPVASPTNLLSQAVRIQATGAQTVTVQSEAGIATWAGPGAWPGQITINLLPNVTHHLTVRASVATTNGPNGCVFPGYTLTTTRDRFGAPLTIVQTGQPTVTVTPTCPPGAPVPLFVEPVTSPTNLLTQTIRIQTTGVQTVTVQSEAGIATWSKPAPWTGQIAVNLLPNTEHHLTVRAYVLVNGFPPACSYNLSVNRDRFGAPLTIVQGSGTPTATPTPTIAPWNGNFHPYAVGDKVSYGGRVYTCIQAHTSQPGWSPDVVPALWQ